MGEESKRDPQVRRDPDAGGERRTIPRRVWESVVEKQIREAMERGEFDNLPGAGKPLDLRFDANTPPEWQLAFKLLRDAGYAPEWIEQAKELAAAREKLFQPFRRYLARLRRRDAPQSEYETRLIAEFRKAAAELNRAIDLFNLKAPTPRVHHPRIRIEAEIEKFRAAARAAKG